MTTDPVAVADRPRPSLSFSEVVTTRCTGSAPLRDGPVGRTGRRLELEAGGGGRRIDRHRCGARRGWVHVGPGICQRFTLGLGATRGLRHRRPRRRHDSTGVMVFVRGGNNALYRRLYVGGSWLDWQYLGGLLASSPAAVADGSGVNVFARGTDNGLYWQRITSGVAQGWGGLGGVASGDPSAAADASGLTVFRGGDGLVYVQRYANGWAGWGQLVESRLRRRLLRWPRRRSCRHRRRPERGRASTRVRRRRCPR